MAGTFVSDTIQNGAGATVPTTTVINGSARAWVNFVGSTATINNSFNVSSVTRASTGNYTMNFTTAMPNANYIVSGSTLGSPQAWIMPVSTGGITTTSLNFYSVTSSGVSDGNPVAVVIHGS
jgi:hypothetical protein